MEIKIVGTGCDKCDTLYANTLTATKELGVEADVIKVEDLMQIVMMGIMTVPALVVDGKVVFAGASLSVDDIKKYIK